MLLIRVGLPCDPHLPREEDISFSFFVNIPAASFARKVKCSYSELYWSTTCRNKLRRNCLFVCLCVCVCWEMIESTPFLRHNTNGLVTCVYE
uniref:Uncharacterized protein n=1 Tax=Gasterosteus aculeatus TaxID=69293 RepID=G3PGF1_GASAC